VGFYFGALILPSNMKKGGPVYIITNQHNTTFYVGVTEDIYPELLNIEQKNTLKASQLDITLTS
jgi:hypothetical protein